VATEAVQSINRAAPEAEASEAIQRLVSLLEEGRVEEARHLAPQLVTRLPDSHALAKLAEALEPPRVIAVGGQTGRPMTQERAWLKEHAREYPGCWMAVFGDRLVAAAPRLRDVLKAVEAAADVEDPVFFFQPGG
jgi:hypothetical protein